MKQKIKPLVIFALLLLMKLNATAQTIVDTATVLDVYNKSDYIFEGKIINQCAYEDPSDGMIYTNNIVDVTKIVKGQIVCGTVSVITLGGYVGDRGVEISHNDEFNVGFCGIFLCNISPYPTPTNSCVLSDDNPPLVMVYRQISHIQFYGDFINSVARGLNSQFEDLQSLYNYVQLFTGIPVIDCEQSNAKPDLAKFYINKPERIITNNLKDYPINRKKIRSSIGGNYGLTDSLITGTATKYLEFNMFLLPNDTIYLDTISFLVHYNSAAFGTNIADSIIAQIDTNKLPTSKYQLLPLTNVNSNTIQFTIAHTDTLIGATFDSINYQNFIHFKMKFIDCYQYPQVVPDTNNITNALTKYKSQTTGTTLSNFSFLNRIKSIWQLNCEAKITSIVCTRTGTNACAGGINDIVTVKGKHFGTDSALIYVSDASYGTTNAVDNINLNASDIVPNSWTDTSFQFIVNNFTDSTFVIGSGYVKGTIGSGPIFVRNKWASDVQVDFSKQIKVEYSLLQWRSFISLNKKNYYPIPLKDSFYTFYRNINIGDSVRWVVKKAIKDWSCKTGINFVLSDSINNSFKTNDSLCNIKIHNLLTKDSNTVIAYTISNLKQCPGTNLDPVFNVVGIDYQINPKFTTKIFCDTTGTLNVPALKVDFYRLSLHEFGHAHSLDHVCDSLDVMWPFNTNDSNSITLSANRIININLNNQNGGDIVMLNTTNIIPHGLGSCNLKPMKALPTTCKLANGIFEIDNKNSILSTIYPNPTKGKLNVNFNRIIGKGKIVIYDMLGSVIYSQELSNIEKTTIDFNPKGGNIILFKIIDFNNNYSETIKVLCEY